jgi:hypothetical protein
MRLTKFHPHIEALNIFRGADQTSGARKTYKNMMKLFLHSDLSRTLGKDMTDLTCGQ